MGALFSSEEYKPKYNPDEYTKVRPGQNTYNQDKKFVYWRGEIVNGAEVKTFVNYGDGYGKDSKNVFYNGYILQTSDVMSFRGLKKHYAINSENVYYKGSILDYADPKTFKVNKDETAIDAKFKYKYGKKIAKKREIYRVRKGKK